MWLKTMTKFPIKCEQIPEGDYCYICIGWDRELPPNMYTELCPFWKTIKTRPYQENGYCLFMQKGDWGENGTFILWDQCKECGENCSDLE